MSTVTVQPITGTESRSLEATTGGAAVELVQTMLDGTQITGDFNLDPYATLADYEDFLKATFNIVGLDTGETSKATEVNSFNTLGLSYSQASTAPSFVAEVRAPKQNFDVHV